MASISGSQAGKDCTCPANAGTCNLTDCQQPWAVKYRKSVRLNPLEKIAGLVAVLFGWGRGK
jgi:hypothetical protein